MPYVINGTTYRTKADVIKQCQRIISSTTKGNPVIGDDYDFLISVLKNHDEWDKKIANGLHGITTGDAPQGTVCFYLKTDTGLMDISFHHAITCMKK
ncbi:Protein of uncharacterised function (DUF3223) [Serratia liquefaciens]|uniref:DUF3223 domain-containing protein n=1 Tax=Serratia TaxID=613 RepID=UPI001377EE0D|nr:MULTISPECIES: DUF3223 domain-containing protein [Serratia]NCG51172.1 DUF3223 domain-containing protein [Serratia fonticola]UNK29260.1 DUF3223 domain-containing protein [Serratia plymuthica]CAI2515310.1 Protein of uncharacterised function (DUF3223) [Serratia liquefaciens]